MKYAFRFLPTARRQLRDIPQPDALAILAALTRLGDDPYRQDAGVKKLQGHASLFRLRVGQYRAVYVVDDGKLTILTVKVGNRRDVYRNLPRM